MSFFALLIRIRFQTWVRFSMVENEYESLMQGYLTELRRYLDVIWPRQRDIQSHMYVNAGKTDFDSCLTICAYDILFNMLLRMCSCCLASKDALRLWHFSGCNDWPPTSIRVHDRHKHVSWRFKKQNTIEGNKDPSHLSWLQRWHVTIIHLQVSNSVIVFVSYHSRYLATLIT
jgi:hypothetical protein